MVWPSFWSPIPKLQFFQHLEAYNSGNNRDIKKYLTYFYYIHVVLPTISYSHIRVVKFLGDRTVAPPCDMIYCNVDSADISNLVRLYHFWPKLTSNLGLNVNKSSKIICHFFCHWQPWLTPKYQKNWMRNQKVELM